MLYNNDVKAHRTQATVEEKGKLTLHDLPFAAGQFVKVLVFAATVVPAAMLTDDEDPFQPVSLKAGSRSRQARS